MEGHHHTLEDVLLAVYYYKKIKIMQGEDVQICRADGGNGGGGWGGGTARILLSLMTLSSTDSQIALLMFTDPLATAQACLRLHFHMPVFPIPSFFLFFFSFLNCWSVDCQLLQVK